MAKKIIFSALIAVALIGGFFYVRTQIYFSHGTHADNLAFEIKKGDGNAQISTNLEKAGLVSNNWYFYIYVRTHGLLNKFMPGKYLLNGQMTIPEIAVILTNPEKSYEQVLFPEGWTAKQIAEELKNHGFDGDAFFNLVKNPPLEIVSQFKILSDKPKVASLEGYLFPDTYYFSKDATPVGILKKILSNTENKITAEAEASINQQNKSIYDILTMASIGEKEVRKDSDRALVSGLFWNRIKNGQRLQSDATLTYILGDTQGAHSIAQTKIDSPYNTYANKGLPAGPICNPGLAAINAAIYPKDSQYNYFLSDPKTGDTIFSKTFEEHVANKNKYGL